MIKDEITAEVMKLGDEDRTALLLAIEQSLSSGGELTAGQDAELNRRLDEIEKNPDSGVSWGDVRAAIRRKIVS